MSEAAHDAPAVPGAAPGDAVQLDPSELPDEVGWFVPGRIEVLGKHTDYAGGRSLLAAVDRGHTVRARARGDQLMRVTSSIVNETIEMDLAAAEPNAREGAGHWSGYIRTVVHRLEANFPGMLRGADVTIDSDLPLAAGMSSSSALVVGLALTLGELAGIGRTEAYRETVTDRETLSEYLGCVENGQSYGRLAGHRGVGTFGGSEDHTAMLCGRDGQLVQYGFCPVRFERAIPFPDDKALVVAVSGVQAEKTGAAREHYNLISLSAREIVDVWNAQTGRHDVTIGDAVRSGPDAIEQLRTITGDGTYVTARLQQFLEESEQIVPAAASALAAGDLATFGDLVDRSQEHAEEGLGNQTPETVFLQRTARRLGAHASSAFGAGFGGSIWALVDAADADAFAVEWLDDYEAAMPSYANASTWLVTKPGMPAHRLNVRT